MRRCGGCCSCGGLSEVLASAVVASFAVLVAELKWLPIPSELSEFEKGPEQSGIDAHYAHAARTILYPGVPALLAFVVPALRALSTLLRCVCGGPSRDEDDSDDGEYLHHYHHPGLPLTVSRPRGAAERRRRMRCCLRVGLALFLWATTCRELWAVLVLRRCRLVEGAISGEGPLCNDGPFALSRHPINVGLLATAAGYAAAEPSYATAGGCGLFALHLWAKMGEEELWLRSHFGEDKHEAYARATPVFLPRWLMVPLVVVAVIGAVAWQRSGAGSSREHATATRRGQQRWWRRGGVRVRV